MVKYDIDIKTTNKIVDLVGFQTEYCIDVTCKSATEFGKEILKLE